jgi:hypothetical protein
MLTDRQPFDRDGDENVPAQCPLENANASTLSSVWMDVVMLNPRAIC